MQPSSPAPHHPPVGATKLPSAFTLFGRSLHILGFNILTILGLVVLPAVIIWVVLVVFFASLYALGNASSQADTGANVAMIALGMAFVLGCIVGSIIINSALVVTLLKGARDEKIRFGEALRQGLHFAWRLFILSIVIGLLVMVGLILFIVPGLFVLKRYILAPYYLVDHTIGPLEAMRRSAEDSKRFGGAIWGLIGVTVLIGIASVIPFGGILQLLYYGAPAARYEEITRAKSGQHHPQAPMAPTAPVAPLAPAPPAPPTPSAPDAPSRSMF